MATRMHMTLVARTGGQAGATPNGELSVSPEFNALAPRKFAPL